MPSGRLPRGLFSCQESAIKTISGKARRDSIKALLFAVNFDVETPERRGPYRNTFDRLHGHFGRKLSIIYLNQKDWSVCQSW